MNIVKIPWAAWYGDGQHALAFPESWTVSVQAMQDGPDMSATEIEAVFDAAVDWPALAQKSKVIKTVAIAVDDLTRPTPVSPLLPPLLTRLQQVGLDQDQIQIVMALGNHRVLIQSDLVKKLGQQVVSELRVRNHSPFSHLVKRGQSSHGVSIEVNRTFAEADLKIGLTGILPHSYTGFSGGAKILLPGLSSIDTTQQFHHMRPLQGDSRTGPTDIVDPHEVQMEMDEVAKTVGLDLTVNVVINSKRAITGLFIGNTRAAYLQGVDRARRVYATTWPDQVDVAVLNTYPKDTEFYQVLNAVQLLQSAPPTMVHEEGTVVLTTAGSEGMGFHYLFGPEGRLPFSFDPTKVIGKKRLFIYSPSVTEAQVRAVFPTGTEFFRQWDQLLTRLQALHGQRCRVAIFPWASIQTAPVQ